MILPCWVAAARVRGAWRRLLAAVCGRWRRSRERSNRCCRHRPLVHAPSQNPPQPKNEFILPLFTAPDKDTQCDDRPHAQPLWGFTSTNKVREERRRRWVTRQPSAAARDPRAREPRRSGPGPFANRRRRRRRRRRRAPSRRRASPPEERRKKRESKTGGGVLRGAVFARRLFWARFDGT